MPVLRVIKEYNNKSPLNGVVETDNITFDSKVDGMRWVKAINDLNKKSKLDWDLIDYEWALLFTDNKEILANPSGGYVGKLH
jgi:hypothetical protein